MVRRSEVCGLWWYLELYIVGRQTIDPVTLPKAGKEQFVGKYLTTMAII